MLCWDLRRVKKMSKRTLAQETGLYSSHITCYIKADAKTKRDLPGWAVKVFEGVCGNTAISQWHAQNAQLNPLEEMQALKALA
ncbi:hypothetical protein APR50_10595 [Variovorax paradoxus]|nr:hypothetical protein APR50_10595 [Variovorax paradoxus]KPV11407.1 hypothetical protein APR49_09470 [Variovorax paradoxus]KPV23299.1 hypothetical protein APR51_08045 [Variovorax paradoxus]KPV31135.1 hypothetical protein APR48_17560 [Variovorax paradoxus]KPV33228.1 hypothetical protein APR47_17945 [Variovorax paradoxus]